MVVTLDTEQRLLMGRRMRAARERKELTMRAVAEAIGVTANSVSTWEHRGWLPNRDLRSALAALYGIKEEDLFREYHEHQARNDQLLAPRENPSSAA